MASTLLPYGLSTQLVDYLTRALKIEQVSNSLVQLHHLDHESE